MARVNSRLTNVPSTQGLVRARATCIRSNETLSGQTDFFTIINNRFSGVSEFFMDAQSQTPASLTFESFGSVRYRTNSDGTLEFSDSLDTVFLGAGELHQLIVKAHYSSGASSTVTGSAFGANYFSSNSEIASVSSEGLITPESSGKATIVVRLDGVIAIMQVEITIGDDSDGERRHRGG